VQDPVVCVTCFALVRSAELHEQWHDAIAGVAIESTKRIDQLERRLQELEASYDDQ
jgi:hypothetical protein